MSAKQITRRRMLRICGAAAVVSLAAGCTPQADDASQLGVEGESASSAKTSASNVWLCNPAGETASGLAVDVELKATMEREGIEKPLRAAESTARVEMLYTEDPYGEVTRLFYDRGWTDGLPIVPPFEQSVLAMIRGTDRKREEVIGVIDPLGGQATVEKIAANAVMAGCTPAFMPILVAAVEAIADPGYDLVGLGTTTSPNATMLVVGGPIAAQVGVNSGANALGRGWTANATIGRALHLVEQNIGGSWPGVSDFSSLGMPGDYSMMLAENDDGNPWQSYREECGFAREDNVATVFSAEGMQLVVDIGVDSEGVLDRVASAISGRDHIHGDYLLVLTPGTASKLSSEGWDKERMRQYLSQNTRVHVSRIEQGFVDAQSKGASEDAERDEPDADGMVVVPFIKSIAFVVAGGVGEKNELIPLWCQPVSKQIVLPDDWEEVLAESQGIKG